ncbi:MAG: NAD(P)/FAD-dependent oxidoreductase [Brotaphodocola sp.]
MRNDSTRRKNVSKHIIIIGGGASGLTAAIASARMGADVTVLEHMDRVGKKILSTGNGRCNLTNLVMDASCYRSGQKDFPMKVIGHFPVKDTLAFFEGIGILTKSRNGYIYPNSDQAASVLDALRLECDRLGVKTVTGCQTKQIQKSGKGMFAVLTDQGIFRSHALILATGSKAAPVTGSDGSGYELAKTLGHSVIKPLPALVQLRCEGKHFKQLAGIRSDAALCVVSDGRVLAAEKGELQLTDYGISGIPTFQISRYVSSALDAGKKVSVMIDFLPEMSMEETRQFMKNRIKNLSYRVCGDFLTGVLNKKLAGVLMKLSSISADEPVSRVNWERWERLIQNIKQFEAKVHATNDYAQAQICCGGADTRQINPDSMESRLVPGLYLIGELVDVDGICGGYNLQWAWSSGFVAGTCAGRKNS